MERFFTIDNRKEFIKEIERDGFTFQEKDPEGVSRYSKDISGAIRKSYFVHPKNEDIPLPGRMDFEVLDNGRPLVRLADELARLIKEERKGTSPAPGKARKPVHSERVRSRAKDKMKSPLWKFIRHRNAELVKCFCPGGENLNSLPEYVFPSPKSPKQLDACCRFIRSLGLYSLSCLYEGTPQGRREKASSRQVTNTFLRIQSDAINKDGRIPTRPYSVDPALIAQGRIAKGTGYSQKTVRKKLNKEGIKWPQVKIKHSEQKKRWREEKAFRNYDIEKAGTVDISHDDEMKF